MRLRGFTLWSKNTGIKEQTAAHETNAVKVIYVCGQDDSKLEKRNALIKSLRSGEGVGVLGLHCLATSKDDLRWALGGRDEKTKYSGIFLRGAFVYCYETKAKLTDMAMIEEVLATTELWAQEARKRSKADDLKYGQMGGRPRDKRMPIKDAKPIWREPGTSEERLAEVNKQAIALGFKPYSRKLAYKRLGPRSNLRISKPKD